MFAGYSTSFLFYRNDLRRRAVAAQDPRDAVSLQPWHCRSPVYGGACRHLPLASPASAPQFLTCKDCHKKGTAVRSEEARSTHAAHHSMLLRYDWTSAICRTPGAGPIGSSTNSSSSALRASAGRSFPASATSTTESSVPRKTSDARPVASLPEYRRRRVSIPCKRATLRKRTMAGPEHLSGGAGGRAGDERMAAWPGIRPHMFHPRPPCTFFTSNAPVISGHYDEHYLHTN
jgi:hypothetical protein